MAPCEGLVHLRRSRESDARGIAEVHVKTWQQAYRDQLPAFFLNALSIDARERYWANELHLLPAARRPWVAESDAGLVGFAYAGPSRDEASAGLIGEVYAINVLPDCWERGLERQLLAHCERDLLDHGYHEAVLWLLADNLRARLFYEDVGWQADGATKSEQIGGRDVTEVRYRTELDRSRVADLI
jgi:GNAT superfamily N-acetyltransferase